MKRHLAVFVAVLVVIGCGTGVPREQTAVGAGAPGAGEFPPCPASPTWVSAPKPPTEIGGQGVPVGDETFCQFYQFAEQWFLSLVSPSSTEGSRVFETFNVVGASGTTSCPPDRSKPAVRLAGKDALRRNLFVRTDKPKTADFDPTLPADLNQATNQGLYDQNGNVVLYAMFYNDTECEATPAGFAPNTIEVKTAWKVFSQPDPSYYMIDATVEFSTGAQKLLLGLVGFHMAINTALHPEFIWATFEHNANAPDCISPEAPPPSGWAFTSSQAAECLATLGYDKCTSFAFNTGHRATTPAGGKPTQVCRSYPDGTDPVPPLVGPNGNRNGLNKFTIDTLNEQLVGPKGILSTLPATNPMAVFANYSMQGAIWTNGGQDSITANQRGSLELANTTMETFVQKVAPSSNTNCFGCHNFSTKTPLDVSHIYQGASAKAAAATKRGAAK